jgi:hypothetical protein
MGSGSPPGLITPNRQGERRRAVVAGEQWRKFEDRIIAAIEEAEIAHKLLLLTVNDKRMLFLRLQKLSEELGFIDDPRGWPDSPEKRQEAARARRVVGETGYFDALTGQAIQNEQDFHALLGRQNNPETIDFVGRAETGKLLIGAFKDTVKVYFTTWSMAPDPHYENFDESVGIIKSLLIGECRAFWLGRLMAPSETSPAANKELPWFDQFPLRDVTAELEGEADRWSKQARDFEMMRRAESAAESVSSEPTATAAAAAGRKVQCEPDELIAEKPPGETQKELELLRRAELAGLKPGWKPGRLITKAGIGKASGHEFFTGVRKTLSNENRQALADVLEISLEQFDKIFHSSPK